MALNPGNANELYRRDHRKGIPRDEKNCLEM